MTRLDRGLGDDWTISTGIVGPLGAPTLDQCLNSCDISCSGQDSVFANPASTDVCASCYATCYTNAGTKLGPSAPSPTLLGAAACLIPGSPGCGTQGLGGLLVVGLGLLLIAKL